MISHTTKFAKHISNLNFIQMNKLQKMLNAGSKEIKGVRAELLNDNMKRAQVRLVMDLEEQYDDMKAQLNSLSDIYPNSEMTLRIVDKNFDPKKWVADTQKLKTELLVKKVELDTAKETLKEWFEDESEESKTKAEDK